MDLMRFGMEVGAVVRMIIPEENGQAFVVFETDPEYAKKAKEGETEYEPAYGLGKRISFDINDSPNAKKAYDTGQEQLEPEDIFSLADRKMVSNYYVPVKNGDEVLALIQVSVEWSENLKAIWRNVWQIEFINLIVLGIVGAIILHLVKMLTERLTALSREQERENTELSIAQSIQQQNLPNVFPAFPDRKEFEILAVMEAFYEVGGDFYDYFMIDDDHLALVIADVSDKGVPAALFMMMAKTRINSIAMSEKIYDPASILEKANNVLCENNDASMFVTTWLGILTVSTGELVTANGGHLDPFICSEGQFLLCEENHGLVLGAMEDMEYESNRWKLRSGDTVFVCTDGVIEAMDDNDIEFGYDRLLNALNKHKEKSLSGILTAVKKEVEEYTGGKGRSDDITMLAIRLA